MADKTYDARPAEPDRVAAPATSSADTPAAGIPTVDRGLGVADPTALIPPRGDTLGEQIDSLHAEMLGSTALGNHTDLWNLVHAFKERVKALVASNAP